MYMGWPLVFFPISESWENRFQFRNDLPPPEVWRPGPKTYPSQTAANRSKSKYPFKLWSWTPIEKILRSACITNAISMAHIGSRLSILKPPKRGQPLHSGHFVFNFVVSFQTVESHPTQGVLMGVKLHLLRRQAGVNDGLGREGFFAVPLLALCGGWMGQNRVLMLQCI